MAAIALVAALVQGSQRGFSPATLLQALPGLLLLMLAGSWMAWRLPRCRP